MPNDRPAQTLGDHAANIDGSVGGDVVTGVKIIIHQGAEIAIPSPQAIAAHRVALRERLEREARARWGGMGVYIQEEGATLPIEASPYQQGRLGPRTNLLETLKQAKHLLVLGEPGAGKTVALERLAWELCNGEQSTIPVLVRLFRYAGTPLTEWLRDMLRQTGHLRLDDSRALEAFLEQGGVRCIFLLDGLNEVAPPYRDRLVDEVVRWLAGHPRHAAILTSRAQDELWRRLRDVMSETVVIQPITDEQARIYLVAQLPDRGETLYNRLDERLRALVRTPLLLWLIKEAGTAGESLPGNRGELYARFVSRMLRRDTERRMDAEIPEAQKLGALTALAGALSRRQQLTCSRAEAVTFVASEWGERAALLLGSCQRHGLLSGEETIWFAPHQTVQEHFAARAWQMQWKIEQQAGYLGAVIRWLKREPSIVTVAVDDWWAETLVQAAGMVTDADALAQAVARENRWLALWCINEGQEVSPVTRTQIEAHSVKLLESPQVEERRRAVQAIAQLRNERVITLLFRAAGDTDIETSQTALTALNYFGEATKPHVLMAIQGQDRTLCRAGLRWLWEYPDETLWMKVPAKIYEIAWGIALVYVPAGSFLMGEDDEQHEVFLPEYWIGKHPVTVAQFRTFAIDYRWADRESLQRPDNHPMINVTWHDASAYCQWLAKKTGLPIMLPSEAEWEKAAAWDPANGGAEGQGRNRKYPWGDESPDAQRCNFNHNVGTTTPVGRYSTRGDSFYGNTDMAGNVWEWTRSRWEDDPDQDYNERRNSRMRNDVLRVVRGGAFSSDARTIRCVSRDRHNPSNRNEFLGFRIALSKSRRKG
jgi:formylglycine-generating enzyme required for sulfatase activity